MTKIRTILEGKKKVVVNTKDMPKGWHTLDNFVVINTKTEKWIEGHYSASKAEHAVDVLNDHEKRNGRSPVYDYIEVEFQR
jgi:hypothetical protein